MRRARRMALAILLSTGLSCSPEIRTGSITVVGDPGPFPTLEEAATAEARVDWWDSDPTDDDACVAGFAATELRSWLPTCLGSAAEPVSFSGTMPARGDVILLRRPDPATGPPGSFRIHLRREGGRRIVSIDAGDRAGQLYGAYGLLEVLGLRFQAPGDSGAVTPSRPSLWPERLDVEETPSFTTRGFWAWERRGHPGFFTWMARNRLNLWTAADTAHVPLMKKLGLRLSGGGHTIQRDFLDPGRHFVAHPDWFGLQDGGRSRHLEGDGGDNFCTSNSAARAALASSLVDSLVSGSLRHVEVLELWPLDQGRWCRCGACAAQGSPSRRWWAVVNDVTSAVERARSAGRLRRPVEVSFPAYMETFGPPEGEAGRPPGAWTVTFFPYFRCYAHALTDSTCTEINQRLARAFVAWSGAEPFSRALGVCEYYNVAAFKSLPVLFPHVMAADLAAYRRAGVTRIQYMHAPTTTWGSWTLHHALFSSLAWNAAADVDSLIADFCRRAYPARAERMRVFYTQLEQATANILALQHGAGVYAAGSGAGRLTEPALPIFPLRHLTERAEPDTLDQAASLEEIDQALAAARRTLDEARAGLSGDEGERVGEVERRFAYGEATLTLYTSLIRTAVAHRARDGDAARRAFATVAESARRLRQVGDLVQVASSHANAADGLEASGVRPTVDYFARLYGR